MLTSVLVANRGEIARRIFRTARQMGIRTIAVYSEADAASRHVAEADEAICIGPAPARESYLVAANILAAARDRGAEAIHPGYGFLSENAAFAEAVLAAGRIWIGPPPAAIRAMGLKHQAKKRMIDAGVPVTPGYLGDDQNADRLQAEAERIGYPVLIKAVAGGGGKGMRAVADPGEFLAGLVACQREAQSSFGDDQILLERYISRPRHLEVQVFGDQMGQVVHLFERDCSLQRRHQKVIEEAPAPGMPDAVRERLCQWAVEAARAVDYVGAGTVEFIADATDGLRADRIWFMEMNTRLQVEHPVTEMITGVDLVEWQFRIAQGEPLPLNQRDIHWTGHAMEARLYAENPQREFLPSIGHLDHLDLPSEGVRVDSAVEAGDPVTPYYDPMLAKLIVHAPNRTAAAARLAKACAAVEVWPVKTNAAFLYACARDPDFVAGEIDTGFIAERLDVLTESTPPSADTLGEAARLLMSGACRDAGGDPWSPTSGLQGFRLNAAPRREVSLSWDGLQLAAKPEASRAQSAKSGSVLTADGGVVLFEAGSAYEFHWPKAVSAAEDVATDGVITAPMPGKVTSISVPLGARVSKGQSLLTLEAMKMEHTLKAPFDGTLAEMIVKVGDQVSEGATLAKLVRGA